jgi:hypothetical protein
MFALLRYDRRDADGWSFGVAVRPTRALVSQRSFHRHLMRLFFKNLFSERRADLQLRMHGLACSRMQVGRFHDCYEIQPAGCTLALWLKASEGASVAAFSISLPRLGLWSAARISPDIVSSHDLAAPFPPSGLRRALAISRTTTAIVVQWRWRVLSCCASTSGFTVV